MTTSSDFIAEAARICTRAAAGDLEARILHTPEGSELAALAQAINRLLDVSDAYVRESAAAMEHCARGEYHRPILLRGLSGAYRHAAGTINDAALKMKSDAETIARFEVERAAVARRVAETTESVMASAEHLRTTTGAIRTHVGTTRQLATEVAGAGDQVSHNVQAVAAACHQLSACTSEITRRTRESAELTNGAVGEAHKARTAVSDLGEATRKIGSVVDIIGKIARQTNLLALNATIEAARAGEHGKSFAVVAAEVKNLSRETAQATERITGQIDAMQGAAHNVVTVIGGIGESIQRMDQTATAIATSVSEQASATEEIARRIADVSQATKSISGKMAEVAQASQALEETAVGLTTAADRLGDNASALKHETAALKSGSAAPVAVARAA
ncbi:MAG: hypothetical protein HZA93_07950 [Verrucomicrobia bacterium]|nr:hypothetical protein [Verrucomicrobiota bacterium]